MFMSLLNRPLSRNKLKSDKSLYSKNVKRELEIRDILILVLFFVTGKTFANEKHMKECRCINRGLFESTSRD